MTMFERLIKVDKLKAVVIKRIMQNLELDMNFPEPTIYRRSGKTTYKKIIVLYHIIENNIEYLFFKKPINKGHEGIEKGIFLYEYNHAATKQSQRFYAEALVSLNIKFVQVQDTIRIEL